MEFIKALMVGYAIFLLTHWIIFLGIVLRDSEKSIFEDRRWIRGTLMAPITMFWRAPIWVVKNIGSVPRKLRALFTP